MSHFYGSMQGGRGETTRTGTKNSGITAHVRTYTEGVDVTATHSTEGADVFDIELTAGSNGGANLPNGAYLRITPEIFEGIRDGRARLAVVPIGDGADDGDDGK